jgi:hypothetical protein
MFQHFLSNPPSPTTGSKSSINFTNTVKKIKIVLALKYGLDEEILEKTEVEKSRPTVPS